MFEMAKRRAPEIVAGFMGLCILASAGDIIVHPSSLFPDSHSCTPTRHVQMSPPPPVIRTLPHVMTQDDRDIEHIRQIIHNIEEEENASKVAGNISGMAIITIDENDGLTTVHSQEKHITIDTKGNVISEQEGIIEHLNPNIPTKQEIEHGLNDNKQASDTVAKDGIPQLSPGLSAAIMQKDSMDEAKQFKDFLEKNGVIVEKKTPENKTEPNKVPNIIPDASAEKM